MKKLSLSMVTILLAAVMLFTGILPMESAQAAGDTILNNLTVDYLLSNLEETIGFGVFAEKWEQNAHSESSACVDVFYKDISGTDPFANSNNTYNHTLNYTLRANVTASGGKYLEGLKFALYKEDGNGDLVKCEGTEVTISGGGNQIKNATLTWSQKQLEGLENVELYVRQVEDASYVEDGGVNTQDMRVYYGPVVTHLEGADNTIYVGKLEQKQIANGEMKFLNTMDYDPLLLFGKNVRLYYKEGEDYLPIEKEDREANGEIYINYTVLISENKEETHYTKFEGFNAISYDSTTKKGTLTKNNAAIRFQYTDRTDYVADLLTNKLNPFSVALATMGNGKGEIREGLKADPTGSSTLTGPVDSEGNVVSMYTVDISDKAVGYDGAYHLEDSDFGKDYIPMAGNEYVVINVICPKSESAENPTVVVPHLPDTFFGNQSNQWGADDSGNSERVLFNFVHKEGTEYKPYTGKVEPHSCFGTYFAPSAFVHVYRQTFNGQIIAKKVRNDSMEIHQRSIARLGRNTYVNMETGRISIQKVVKIGHSYAGDAGNGAEFGIFSKADCKPEDLVTTMTTSGGSDWAPWSQFKPASAASKWLPTGTYWVRELKSPDGYSINTTIVEVQVEAGQTKAVSKEGYTETINFFNQDYENVLVNDSDQSQGKLKIVKRDKDDHTKTLAGATFGIYEDKACNKLITYVTTGSDGTATIALHIDWQQMGPGPGIGMGPGNGYGSASKKYYVKELIAPEGYALDEKVHEVTVQDNNIMDFTVVTTTLNVDNKLLTGRIRLYKESFDERKDGKPVRLGGAVFQLFYDEAHTKPVSDDTYTTKSAGNEIGKLEISPVPYGTYWVYETKAPDGYELDPNRKAYKVVVDKPVEQPCDVEGDRVNEDNNKDKNIIVNKKKEIETSLQLEIPVAKVIDPVGKAADETFTFKLEPAPSAPPAPPPADNDCSASVVGAGTATTDKFGVIEIKKDKFDSDTFYGDYNSVEYGWLVFENKGTNPSIEYDDAIYWVRTTVVRDDDGNMFFSTGNYDNNGNLILSDTAHLDISKYKPKPKDQQNSGDGFEHNNEYFGYIGKADSVVFTNKVLTTSISVNKEWVGGEPDKIDLTEYLTVHKLGKGSLSDPLTDANGNVLQPKSEDGKTYTFSDLPAGYTYAVKEKEVPGYATTYPPMNIGEADGQNVKKDFALDGETITNSTTGASIILKKTVKNLGNVPYAGAETFTFIVDYSSEVDKTEGSNLSSGVGDMGFFCELKNGETKEVHFNFTQPGTYTVTVTEGEPADHPTDGMVYSKEIYRVIYRVELVGNALKVTGETWQYAHKDIDKPDAAEFVNTYEKYYTLTLKKTDKLNADKGLMGAVYGLFAEDDETCQKKPVYTIKTDEDGIGKVEDIAKGTYWLKEITAPEGYDVDPNPVKVMVPPSASSPDGSLNVNVADYPLGQVKVQKVWVGDTEANRPDSITVQLYKNNVAEGNPIQLTAENGWQAAVENLPMYDPALSEPTPYAYTWKEVEVPSGYNLTGNVTETENGVEITTLTNTLYTADGSIQFSGEKTLTGDRALKDGEFSFQLSDENGVVETVKNAADGSFAFSAIKYTLEDLGDHTYTVQELAGSDREITYDATTYTIQVNVSNNGDGTLKVTTKPENIALNFENKYTKHEADGEIQFKGTKTLKGDRALAAEEFSFQLSDENGVVETVKNAADGSFAFSVIQYTLADVGDHTYTVQELAGSDKEITYDATTYTIQVNVSNNGDGTLKVTTKPENIALNFENKYTKHEADGEIQFKGTKTLTGDRALAVEEFSFQLSDENGVVETVKNAADGSFAFSAIQYTLSDVGEHTYTVKEVIPETKAEGITYDETIYTVKVKVTDAGDGKLNAEVISETAKDALNFVNKYGKYTASGELTLDVEKAMMGREFVSGDMFTFTISAVSGVPMPEKTMVTITPSSGKTAKVDFGKILFTEADAGKEYTYTVKELSGQKEGITYDDKFHTVTVKLADDGKGNILATPTYADGSRVTLTNMYNAEGELTLDVEKTIKGRTFKTGDSFTFTITAAENAPMPEKTEVTLTPTEGTTAKVDFGKITYSLADAGKTYEYTLKEVAGQQDGITYDANAYTVKVTVADNGQGGLNVTPAYEAGSRVTFVNTYGATGTYQLTATKELIGKKLTDGQFTFVLKNEQGKELATATNTADGQITFKAFNFSQSDIGKTYTYYVSERMEGLEGYTYDTTVFEVKLTVSDNGDGTLTVTASGLPEGGMKFRNSYFASTNVVFYKKWQGKEGPAISLTLYQNGVKMDPQPEYVKVGNVYTYEGLPLYDENEKLFVYSATESFMDGYMTIYENKAPYAHVADQVMNGGTIINRGVSNVSVRKVWQGLAEGEQAPEITLSLYCNGVKLDKATPVPDKDGWYHYYNLPTTVDGVDAVYTVKEEAMEGFNTIYLSTSGEEAECAMNGDTIQNRKIPKTGDNTPIGLWMAVTALSAMGFVLAVKKRKTVG